MMRYHAVEDDGHICRFDHLFAIELRRFENHVVAVPLSFRQARVHHRWIEPVNRARAAVGVGRVIVTREHLEFVTAHEDNAAVAAELSDASWLHNRRRGPFEMQLHVSEALFCDQAARAWNQLDIAVFDLPFRLAYG